MFPLPVWELVHQTINCIGYFTLENWIVLWTNVRVVIWYEHECPGGNLMWARLSGVVIWCEHECPGWSFEVSTNVRPCQKSRGNECPWERMSVHQKKELWALLLLFFCFSTECWLETKLNYWPVNSLRTWTIFRIRNTVKIKPNYIY